MSQCVGLVRLGELSDGNSTALIFTAAERAKSADLTRLQHRLAQCCFVHLYIYSLTSKLYSPEPIAIIATPSFILGSLIARPFK